MFRKLPWGRKLIGRVGADKGGAPGSEPGGETEGSLASCRDVVVSGLSTTSVRPGENSSRFYDSLMEITRKLK